MFPRSLRALFHYVLTLLLLCWAGGVWAATSGTMSFSSGDADLDYAHVTIPRTVGLQDFTVSGGAGFGGLAFDAGGIYANESGGNNVKLTITAPAGYQFDLTKLDAMAALGSFLIDYTQVNATPLNMPVSGVSTTASLSTHTVNLTNLTQVVLSSSDYAVFNTLVLTNIQPMPPVAGAVSATVAHGSSNNAITLALSGGPAASVAVSSAASHGTATASGTSITYTPTASYSGSDSFSYTATNAAGTSTAATVTVTVSSPTLAISPLSGTVLTGGVTTGNYSRTFAASGGTAPYIYALVINTGSLPTGLSFSTATGVLSGTPSTAGTVSFTVAATDSSTGTGPFAVAGSYLLTVSAVPVGTLSFTTPTSASVNMTGSLTNAATSTVSGGGAGAISYSSANTGVATVDPITGVVTPVSVGTVVITATQAAVAGVNAQATQTYTLTVNALPLGTISFATPTSASVTQGGSLTNAATSTVSGGGAGAISYGSSDTGVATVNPTTGVVTTVSAGTTVITATQAAVAGVNAQATQTYTLTVNPLPLGTVSFATPTSASVTMGGSLTNAATSTLSGGSYGAISYSSSDTGVATVNASGVVTPVSVGTTTITATQAAVAGVNALATRTYTLTVNALPVGTLSFATPTSASVALGNTLSNTATSTLSGGSYGSISYSSANTAVATVNASGVVSPVSVGTAVITATQAAVAGVNAQATQTYTVTVTALPVGTLSFATPTSASVTLGNTLSNVASSTLSGGSYGAISYSSANTAVAMVNPTTGLVTPVSAGTVVITATQAAVASVNAQATQTYTLTVNLPVGTLSFTTPTAASVTLSGSLTNAAISTLSGGSYGAISYSSANTGVATVNSSGVVTPVSVGTVVITATQAATGVNAQATQTYTLTVSALPVGTLSFATPTAASVTLGNPLSNIASSTLSGGSYGAISYSSANTAVATVNPTTGLVTPVSAGTVVITATQAAVASVNAQATQTYTLTVSLPPVPIAGAVTASVIADSSNNVITLSLTGGSANSVAVFSAPSHGTATVSGVGITYTPTSGYVGSDSFTYKATNLGGTSAAATVTINVTAPPPSAPVIGTATAGDRQATVSFTLSTSTGAASATGYTVTSTPGNISVTGTTSPITVTGLTNGTSYTFVVKASNTGGDSAVSAASNSVIPKVSQTITLSNPGTQSFTATPTVSASASSGGTVTYSSSTPAVCSVSASGSLSFLAAGTCTITATQAGTTVLAAVSTTQSFTVNPVPPSPPGVTSIVTASTQATISFNPPTFTGGTTISGYQVTATPTASPTVSKLLRVLAAPAGAGVVTATGTSSPIKVTGLTNGVTYTFAVSALNSAGSGTTTQTVAGDPVTGTPQEKTPVTQAVSVTVAYGSSNNAITLNLGGDTPSSLALVNTPSHGTATISGINLSYTPAAGYVGTDSFSYTASNGGGTSAAATVSITVTPTAPAAGNVTFSVLASSRGNLVPLSLSGGTPDSVAIGSSPSHGTVTVAGTRIAYTPDTSYTGSDSFTYTATNTGGTSAPGTVTIQVLTRPDPTKDAEVTGLLNAQAAVATRFAQTQISNIQSHLEGIHNRSQAKADDEPARSLAGRPVRGRKATVLTADTVSDASANISTGTGTATGTGASTGSTPTCASRDPKLCEIMSSGSGSAELASFVVSASKSIQDGSGWPWRSLSLDGKNNLGEGNEVWSAGTITLGRQGDSDLNFTSSGVSFGADQRINEKLLLGMSMGFGYERQKIGDASTRNNAQSYSISGYQSYQPAPNFYLDGLLGYSHLNYDLRRYVAAAGSDANSDRTGSQWFASLSGGYEYRQEQTLLSPYGRFDWISTRLERNEETGAGNYNLTYFDQTIPVSKVSVGLRGETQREISYGKAKPYFRVEYQRNLESPSTAEMAYADLLSTIYRYDLNNVDRNTLIFGLGSNFVIRKHQEWQLGYQYGMGSGSSEAHTINLQFKQAF